MTFSLHILLSQNPSPHIASLSRQTLLDGVFELYGITTFYVSDDFINLVLFLCSDYAPLIWLKLVTGSKTTARRLQPGSMSTHPANIRHTNYALHHGYCHFKSSLLSRIQTMLTVGKAGELMSAVDESPLPLLLGMNSLLVLAELPEPFYL